MRRSTYRLLQAVAILLIGVATPVGAAPKPKPTATPTLAVTPTRTPTATATPTRTPTATPRPSATPTQPAGLSVTITDPMANVTIDSNTYNVVGTFSGPANTGVVVNDRVAYTSGGRFVLNDLPVVAGTNTITAVATNPAGQSATTAVTVTASGSAPDLVLHADISRGVAPLSVTFTYEFRSTQTIDKLAIDFNGDGRDDFSTRKPPTMVQNTYTNPGLFMATLTITDNLRTTHKATVGIEVGTSDARDSLFRSVWDTMNAALVRGDVPTALASLNVRAQERYAPVFNDLVAEMPAIVASYSAPQFVSADSDYFEYAINRVIDGENQIFLVYLLRDGDGVWRMDSM